MKRALLVVVAVLGRGLHATSSGEAETAVSRLYGGIHYRSDNEVGLTLGRRVGGVALRAYHVG